MFGGAASLAQLTRAFKVAAGGKIVTVWKAGEECIASLQLVAKSV